MKTVQFHYYTGEIVRVGDRVRYAGRPGVVKEIVYPDTELAQMFQAPGGGVLVTEDWSGCGCLAFLEPPDGLYW